MKLLLELLTLLLLFVLFRGAVKRFIPKKTRMQGFSIESLAALRKFRIRYFRLLLLFIVLIGSLSYFLLALIKNQYNPLASQFSYYLPLKDSALLQAALLGGLLLGSLIAFSLNRKLQSDGLSFYLEELQELMQGYQSFGTFRYLQYSIGLLLFTILTYSVLSTGLGIDKDQVTEVHPFGEYVKHPFKEIKKLNTPKDDQLLLDKSDTINLALYKYNSKDLELYLNTN